MTQGFDTDTGLMRNLAATLHRATAALDSIGSSVPGAPDAGEVSAAMAGVLGHLTRSAGELVVGTAVAGDELGKGADDFDTSEDAAEHSFDGPR
ncbi:MAG: hypothetical protein ACRDT0_14245 [Pseudonocardiaceae bacterium]